MPSLTLPLDGRIAEAEMIRASTFVFGVGRGLPAWDAQWTQPNPPAAPLEETQLRGLIGYARPSLIEYLREDAAGTISVKGGLKFSSTTTPTRYVRVRMSLPQGTFAGETVREIGLFIKPTIASGVPAGQVVLTPSQVTARGRLYQVEWREPYPITEGDYLSASFIARM